MSKLSKDFSIKLTTSVEDSISKYFSDVKKIIAHYSSYLERNRQLDFLKMRRFLATTYKTLQELDPTFMAHKLINLRKHLDIATAVYDDFKKKEKIGVHSFELIFLESQEHYLSYEGRLAHNSDEITHLRQLAENFKEKVENAKNQMAQLTKQKSEYERVEKELKQLKTRENNVLIRLGDLVEENAILYKALTEFRQIHEEQFFKVFKNFIYNVSPNLMTILNALAFEFDVNLWHKAKESPIIQSYFANANAGSVVSSKTYLKFFLKNLDTNKLTKENQELYDLYQYFNEDVGSSVLLYFPDEDDRKRFNNALESSSSSLDIYSVNETKEALAILTSKTIQVLFLDVDIPERSLIRLIEAYTKKDPKMRKKTKIILVVEEVNDERIEQAKRIQADSVIERDIAPIEIIDTVYALL